MKRQELVNGTWTLLTEVDKFLRNNRNITASRLGRNAVKDPNFVSDIRNSRVCNQRTIDRVLRYIEQNTKEKPNA